MIRVLFLTFIILSFRSFSSERLAPPLIKKGEVNLKGFKFEENTTFKLKGEWRFFWKKWVSPKDVVNNQIPKKTSFVPVPKLWNQYNLKGDETSFKSGYASYLIKISGLKDKHNLALYLRTFSSNYRLYLIDGQKISLLGSQGVIGKTEKTSIPNDESVIYPLKFDNNMIYLLLHCSNFHYRSGGFFSPIHLGKEKDLRKRLESKSYRDFLSIGVFIIMGVYHFFLFFLRRKDKASFWFALFCCSMFLRKFTESDYIFKFYPNSKFIFNWNVTIEYLTLYLGLPIFTSFLWKIIKFKHEKNYQKFIWSIVSFYSLATLFLNPRYFTHGLIVNSYNIIMIIFIFYGLLFVFKAVKQKQPNAFHVIIGILALFFGVVYDNLVLHKVIPPPFILSYTFILFILFQSFILAKRFSNAFNTAERLSKELELEIVLRTKEALSARLHAEGSEKRVTLILDNMNQSVFTINRDLIIQGPVSKFSFNIFSQEIEGTNIFDTVFKGIDRKSEKYSGLDFAVWALFESDSLQWEISKSTLPPKVTYKKPNELQVKTLKISYSPIYDSHELIEKIMLIVEDITELQSLEEAMKTQEEKSSKKTTIVQEMIQSSKEDLILFFDNSYKLLDEAASRTKKMRNNLPNYKESDLEFIARQLHTLKGNSRLYNLSFISSATHEIENNYSFLTRGPEEKDKYFDNSKLNQLIQDIYELKGIIYQYTKTGKDIFSLDFKDDIKLKENINKKHTELEYLLNIVIPQMYSKTIDFPKDLNSTFFNLTDETYSLIVLNLHVQKGFYKSIGESDLQILIHDIENFIQKIRLKSDILPDHYMDFLNKIKTIKNFNKKIYIDFFDLKPSNIGNTHFSNFFTGLHGLTKSILDRNEKNINVNKFQEINSIKIFGEENKIPMIQALSKNIINRSEKNIILESIKSLWDYCSFILSINILKMQPDDRVYLRNNLPKAPKLLSHLFKRDVLFLKFLEILDYDHINTTYKRLFKTENDWEKSILHPEGSYKIIDDFFMNLKNFDSLNGTETIEESDLKQFIKNKIDCIFKNDFSHFGFSKFITILQIFYSHSDIEKEKKNLLRPNSFEVMEDNFSKFKSRLNQYIFQNQSEETNLLQQSFRELLELPVKYSFNRFRTVINDIAESLGKKVNFQITGDQGSLNKESLSLLHDALTHLIRNSLDHGIEDPKTRAESNKEELALIKINCQVLDENKLQIIMEDDGRGINEDIIAEQAIKKGLKTKEDTLRMSSSEKLNLIFLPGLSTKEHATEISGRGVGMDVVKENLKAIKAHLSLESEKNKGTKFTITLHKRTP